MYKAILKHVFDIFLKFFYNVLEMKKLCPLVPVSISAPTPHTKYFFNILLIGAFKDCCPPVKKTIKWSREHRCHLKGFILHGGHLEFLKKVFSIKCGQDINQKNF
jgi:hypothetical protein